MGWIHSLDVAVLRFINGTLSNPLFDTLMPFVSGNAFFVPILALVVLALLWKGGIRGRIFVLLALTSVAVADGWICNAIKEAVARPRPFLEMPDINLLTGSGRSNGMPSAHSANWFAGAMMAFIFYRRSWRFMLPLALLVCFSRIYNGVHYPTDVLAGAIIGAGTSAAVYLMANAIWQFVGRRWFPIWWQKVPSLLPTEESITHAPALVSQSMTLDQHWLRVGYIFIFALFIFRLFYIASGTIELSEDEAYQWTWSKHLALSYFSKPPLIAYTQFLGTSLWGDTELGVRFFSPVINAIVSLLLLRFIAREANARVGIILIAIVTATPLASVGAVLMTIDPLSVLFWTGAMLAGWRAVQTHGTARDWLWVGLWMGLGFLSKYTNLFQLLSWVVLFLLWPPARKHLRRPGPYLALLIVALSLTPVLIWNQQHGWITIEHVSKNGGFGQQWKPTLRYLIEFLGAETFLLNPIFFIAMIWAGIAFWRSRRENPLLIFLFSMGAPLFLFYLAFSLRSRILPNWIAPSVVPLFCFMVLYFHKRWRQDRRILKPWLLTGLIFGTLLVVLLHNTDTLGKVAKRFLPAQVDPLRRVRGWKAATRMVDGARQKLEAEGKPAFIIGDHYGAVGLMSFYSPVSRQQIRDNPMVYFRSSPRPKNQFYFWPGYESRNGQNAIYVKQIDLPRLQRGWIWKWLGGDKNVSVNVSPKLSLPPREVQNQFASITDLGVHDIFYRKRLLRRVQLFECRDLRDSSP